MNPAGSLADPFGRRITYLRLSVTDRCDLRCFYCLPGSRERGTGEPGTSDDCGPPASLRVGRNERLGAIELERIVRVFIGLGVTRIRLTGGEPLTRPDLLDIARRIGALPGLEDLSLSTNASRLATLAGPLRQAGVTRLNVSLDTLDPRRYARITGGGRLDGVLAGLAAARRAGLAPIKINTVAMRGVNDDELPDMVRFCRRHGYTLRLIETMPVGRAGQGAGEHYLPLGEVERQLGRQMGLVADEERQHAGPARYLRHPPSGQRVGLITPMSRHFCASCNRLRLTADGLLHPCLDGTGSVSLAAAARAGDTAAMERSIQVALLLKPERHHFGEDCAHPGRSMAYTGG